MTENKLNKKNYAEIFWGAFQMAVLFLPAHYLNTIISLKLADEALSVSIYVVPIVCAVLSGIAVYSRNVKQALAKWGLSVPFTVVFWIWTVKTEFYKRSLNWVFRGYGEASAGGDFAGLILLGSAVLFNFVAIVIAVACSNYNKQWDSYGRKTTVLKIIGSLVCIGILAVFIALNNFIIPRYIHNVY